jgi:hypothetical protein
LQISFPKLKNNFEAAFSRVKDRDIRFCLAIAAGEIANFEPRKSHSKLFSDFGKKIYKTKPALSNNFSLGPKEI